MAQDNRALIKLMDEAEKYLDEHPTESPATLVHVAEIQPGEPEAKLSTRVDRIEVIQCEIDGDTVPFEFDSATGTLDLPDHLEGRPVKVTYTSSVKDADTLRRIYQSIRQAEIERQTRDEWAEAWERSEHDVAPVPQPDPGIVVGETAGGPYRSAKIVKYTPKPEPKLPWYRRLWLWLTRSRTWA